MARIEEAEAVNANGIGHLVARLEDLSSQLHDRLATLEERLAPIIESVPPNDKLQDADPEVARSQVASNLWGVIIRLERMDAAMAFLCDRIDL